MNRYIILTCSLVIISFLLLKDAKNPLYSYIGDEYDFYKNAQEIATLGISPISFFSQNGVYGHHPVADSVLQAFVMKIFGINLIGWKITNIITIILSSFLIYNIAQIVFNDTRIGLLSSLFFITSHYVFAFAHIGYNNLLAFLPFLAALYSYLLYVKTRAIYFAILCGVFSAFCFYTFYSARLILLLLIPRMIFFRDERQAFLPFLSGFLLIFFPFVYTNKISIFSASLNQSFSHPLFSGINLHIIFLFILSLFRQSNVPIHHFVIGPLFSPVMTFFLVVGYIQLLISKNKKNIYTFISWGMLVCLVILLTFYDPDIPTTRLHIIIPAYAIISAFGIVSLIKKPIVITLFFIFHSIWSYYTFFIKMPLIHPMTPTALTLNIAMAYPNQRICTDEETRTIALLYDVPNIYSFNEQINSPKCTIKIVSTELSDMNNDETYSFSDPSGQTHIVWSYVQ